MKRAILIAVLMLLSIGCVDRRFLVTSNVPGAQIAIDGRVIGPAPADSTYDYAGWYEFRANAPGYEPLVRRHKFEPRWFDYPGLDFFAEVLWPFRIEDRRTVHLELQPSRPLRNDELISSADALRARAANLPEPRVPNDNGIAQPPVNDRRQNNDTLRPPPPSILPNTR